MGKIGRGRGDQNLTTSSARGYPGVIATCEPAREKEASRELLNLLDQSLEYLSSKSGSDGENCEGEILSVQKILEQEIEGLKSEKRERPKPIVSLRTDAKGVVLVKITIPDIDIVEVLYSIFQRIEKDKLPCCRYLIRLTPLQFVFYPNDDEFQSNIKMLADMGELQLRDVSRVNVESSLEKRPQESLDNIKDDNSPKRICIRDINDHFQQSEEKNPSNSEVETVTPSDTAVISCNPSTDPSPKRDSIITPLEVPNKMLPAVLKYSIEFKSRNHNVLTKTHVQKMIRDNLPSSCRFDPRQYEGMILVSVLKNICGISFVRKYKEFFEFNVRKYQNHICGISTTSVSTTGQSKETNKKEEGESTSREVVNDNPEAGEEEGTADSLHDNN